MCTTCEVKVNSPAPATVVSETRRDNIRVKLPEFSGHPYEDPEKFTRACQDRLARYGVPKEEWTERVTEQLRGPAMDWWSMTGEYGVEREDFAPRLEARFNAARACAQCQRALFCEPQRADEDVETFIRSKVRLHRRLDAGGPVNTALDVTVELMKRELRLHLRGAVDSELEDFVQLAKEIEQDLRLSPRPRDTAARRQGASPSSTTAPEDAWAVVPYVNLHSPSGTIRRGGEVRERRATTQPAVPSANTTTPRAARANPRADGQRDRPPRCHYCREEAYHWHEHPSTSCTRSSTSDAASLAPPTYPAQPAGPERAPPLWLGRAGNTTDKLMRVPVLLNGQPVHALVDTAASHTYVVAHLVPEADLEQQEGGVQLATWGASALMTGRAQVRIAVRDMCSRTTALVVPELRDDLILGLPWLVQEDAAIDVGEGRIHVGRQGRRTLYSVNQRGTVPPTPAITLADLQNEVPPEYRNMINEVLAQQAQVFAAADMLRRTTVTQHTIPTRPHEPRFVKPFGFGPREREAIQTQIAEMLQDGVIEPSDSPYNCLVVMAKKKDGSLRFCVNFKPINAVTILTPPPIINITDALAGLGEAGIFTSLDLKSGYWQVPVCPEDRPKTAFTAPDGRRP
ncbi:uncharacterized protein LOC134528922 [Bacillus rossius redtenbacheri]|uniref:uncharacterized protein LOC134528922 n=1 Tax=Bacillus rossius redtenbacheri TaxID=93214 RepID=UPI002FDDB818